MKFSGHVDKGTWNKWFDFGSDQDHSLGAVDLMVMVIGINVWIRNVFK